MKTYDVRTFLMRIISMSIKSKKIVPEEIRHTSLNHDLRVFALSLTTRVFALSLTTTLLDNFRGNWCVSRIGVFQLSKLKLSEN